MLLPIVLALLCILFLIVVIVLLKRSSSPSASSIAIPASPQYPMFELCTLPMCYRQNDRFIVNKAFEQAFGSFAKQTFDTLAAIPKYGEHTLELLYDNAVSKTSLVYLSSLNASFKSDFLATIVDVSSMHRCKQNLLVQKERLELALEGSNEALWDWDMVHESVFYAQAWKETMGYTAEDATTTLASWLNLVHPKDMAMVNERLRMHIDSQSDTLILEHRIRQTEPTQWVKVHAKIIRGKDNQAVRMVGTLEDITQQKMQTATVERDKTRYIAYFDRLPALAFIKNAKGEYLYLNLAFQKFLGFPSWQGKTADTLFDAETTKAVEQMDRLSRYEGILSHALALTSQEGIVSNILFYTFMINEEDGEKLICGFGINKSFTL